MPSVHTEQKVVSSITIIINGLIALWWTNTHYLRIIAQPKFEMSSNSLCPAVMDHCAAVSSLLSPGWRQPGQSSQFGAAEHSNGISIACANVEGDQDGIMQTHR